MTREDKRKFVAELIAAVTGKILSAVNDMPEAWDGIELREYIAERFERESEMKTKKWMRARYRAFKEEIGANWRL